MQGVALSAKLIGQGTLKWSLSAVFIANDSLLAAGRSFALLGRSVARHVLLRVLLCLLDELKHSQRHLDLQLDLEL